MVENKEQQSLQLIDESPVGIFYTDQHGDTSYVNKRWCEITGISHDNANNEAWLNALHPQDRSRAQAAWQAAVAKKEAYQSIHRYRHADGQTLWVLAIAYPSHNKLNQNPGYIGTLVDITEQKLTEIELAKQHEQDEVIINQTQQNLQFEKARLEATTSALMETEALWQSFMENTFDYILTVDKSHKITFINRTQDHLSFKDVINKSVYEFIEPDYQKVLQNALYIVFTKGEAASYEVKSTGVNDTPAWYACKIGPVKRRGEIIAATIIATDITERMQIEKGIQQHQNMLNKFSKKNSVLEVASCLAHELNQPLGSMNNYIKGFVHRIKAGDVDKNTMIKLSEKVEAQIERACKILDNMRDSVSNDGCDFKLASIIKVVEEAVGYVDPDVLDHVMIETHFEENIPPVLIDTIQIEQVLINIVQNAYEAMLEAKVVNPKIIIEVRHKPQYVIIAITDLGHGIDPRKRDSIFEAFISTKPQNMGMGLAICRSIIETHGGHLTATNNASCGATFTIELPIPKE